MADLRILDGSTFFYSEDSGDVDAERQLSLRQLLIDGKPIDLLRGRMVDYYSAHRRPCPR